MYLVSVVSARRPGLAWKGGLTCVNISEECTNTIYFKFGEFCVPSRCSNGSRMASENLGSVIFAGTKNFGQHVKKLHKDFFQF